jgi:hypothetical protein
MKNIIAIALVFSMLFPVVSHAQEQVTVEYVEQVRQNIINTLLAEIARIQKIIYDYIASQQQDATAIGGSPTIEVITEYYIAPQPVVIEPPQDTTPPKILKSIMYNTSGRGGSMWFETDEPTKITVRAVRKNDNALINANAVRNSWDDVADEAYNQETLGNFVKYTSQGFATSTKVYCIDAGMTNGERYIIGIDAVDESGNVAHEQYLRGKKYGNNLFCEAE